jgi:VanZ family protein
MLKPRFQFIFFIVWFILILILSVIPDNSPDTLKINMYELRLDYLKHFFVYLPLGFFLLSIRRNTVILTILLGLFVVSLPEVLQYFIPYRAYNPFDLLANFVGLICGIALYNFFAEKLKNAP